MRLRPFFPCAALAALGLFAAAGCVGRPMPENEFGQQRIQHRYESGELNYHQYVTYMRVYDPKWTPPPAKEPVTAKPPAQGSGAPASAAPPSRQP